MHGFIRERLAARYGARRAARIRILYGGSVKPAQRRGNCWPWPNVNGALVGGASLKADDFLGIAGESV